MLAFYAPSIKITAVAVREEFLLLSIAYAHITIHGIVRLRAGRQYNSIA